MLPLAPENDRADTPRFSWYLHWSLPELRLSWLKRNNQWTNVVHVKAHASTLAEHRQWLPKIDVPLASGSAGRVLTYDSASDEAVWEKKTIIHRGDPIQE